MKQFVSTLSSTISHKLPEGKFKEWLRSYFFKHSNPIYVLNKIISNIELENEILAITLHNGFKLYGRADKSIYPVMKYADQTKLGRISEYKYFGTFLLMISEQFEDDCYEKAHKLGTGETVIDIGANIGIFTVKAAKAVGETGKIVAIEPEESNLKLLKRNIEANNLNNVVIIPKGIWSEKTRLEFKLSSYTGEHSLYEINNTYQTTIEIETDTLDNILNELGIKKVDFIKMDIEGAEVEAIKGMNETLAKANLKIAGEHHIVNGKSTYDIIAKELGAKGFKVNKESVLFYANK